MSRIVNKGTCLSVIRDAALMTRQPLYILVRIVPAIQVERFARNTNCVHFLIVYILYRKVLRYLG